MNMEHYNMLKTNIHKCALNRDNVHRVLGVHKVRRLYIRMCCVYERRTLCTIINNNIEHIIWIRSDQMAYNILYV